MRNEDQEFLSGLMDGEWQTLDVRRAITDVCGDEALREKWSRYHLARHALQRESVVPGGALAERIARAIADEPAHSNVTAIGAFAAGADAPSAAVDDRPADGERHPAASVRPESVAAATVPMPLHAASGRPPVAAPAPRAATARTFAAGFGLAASVAVVTAFGLNALQVGEGVGPVPGEASTAVAPSATEGATTLASSSGSGATTSNAVEPFARSAPGAILPNVELVSNTVPSGAYWSTPDSTARRAGSEARLNLFLSQHIEHSPTAERQGMLPYSRLVGYDGERVAAGR